MNYSYLPLMRMINVTTCTGNYRTDTVISRLHFTAFFQREDKNMKEVKTTMSRGHGRIMGRNEDNDVMSHA